MRQRPVSVKPLCAAVLVFALALASCVCAGQEARLPKYTPAPLDAGVIRAWGDDAMLGTMVRWQQAFRKYHPEITFQNTLHGTATGMAGIITGVSDLALMGRPVTVNEVIGFEWVFRTKPLGIQIMTGGLEGEGATPALAVFVSRRNPLRQIGMPALGAILGCPSEAKARPTWAMTGARGAWANKPIHAYIFDSGTGTGAFLQQAVQGEKDCWNWSMVREFKDSMRSNGTVYSAGQQIVDALKDDPYGLAVSTVGYAGPEIRLLALAGAGSAAKPTAGSLIDGSYPLTRGVYIYINRRKDKPIDAKVKEFLQFILSSEGQALVQRQGDYLPLSSTTDLEQLKKLE